MTDPRPDEVMRSALEGAGFTSLGMPTAERLWRYLLPEVERMEATTTLATGRVDEAAISDTTRAVVEGLLARHRYAAALKAEAKRGRRKRAKK